MIVDLVSRVNDQQIFQVKMVVANQDVYFSLVILPNPMVLVELMLLIENVRIAVAVGPASVQQSSVDALIN